jgi:ABC-type antimicrobial peptide transport system ATPase subunit
MVLSVNIPLLGSVPIVLPQGRVGDSIHLLIVDPLSFAFAPLTRLSLLTLLSLLNLPNGLSLALTSHNLILKDTFFIGMKVAWTTPLSRSGICEVE